MYYASIKLNHLCNIFQADAHVKEKEYKENERLRENKIPKTFPVVNLCLLMVSQIPESLWILLPNLWQCSFQALPRS